MGTDKGGIILFGTITLVLVVFDVWLYAFAPCDSFMIRILPQREIPARCISILK
jgi:hypothetical protein